MFRRIKKACQTQMNLPAAILIALVVSSTASGQSYTISTFAGGALPVNIPGTTASLGVNVPVAVASDKAGNLYFPNQHTVMRLDAVTGILSIVAGNGTTGFSGDNGPATSAQLHDPLGLALDSAGNLYIADHLNFRIRKVSGGVITTVAGNGLYGLEGDNGPAINAQLHFPSGIALDSAGSLYIVCDYDRRIRKVANGVITTVAGGGASPGDNIAATSAQLSQPSGVAVDSAGNLYIADAVANRVRKVSAGMITTVAGNGVSGFAGDNGPATSAQLNFPNAMAVDSSGAIYIADLLNARVRRVSAGVITTLAGTGSDIFSGENGPAASAQLSQPSGLALDAAGNLYIADRGNYRIRKVSKGQISTVAGNGTPNFSGDNGPASRAQMSTTTGIALSFNGDLYLSDPYNRRVRKVSGGVITSVAGSGEKGSDGDGDPATSARLTYPTCVAVDSAGNLYFSDGSSIRRVSNGAITTAIVNLQYPFTEGIAADAAGNLYMADGNYGVVRKLSGGVTSIVAGTGRPGYSGDDGPATSAQLSHPIGITLDASGSLYIADSDNRRVRRVTNGVITTVAGNGTGGHGGDGGPATKAQFVQPLAVALDASGNLFIADGVNIRKVSGGVITTIAGNGTEGYSGDRGPALNAQLFYPAAIAVDPGGIIFVADYFNHVIRALTPSGPSCSASVALVNQPTTAGGNVDVAIRTGASCAWAVQSLPSWITFSGSVLGSGAATVTLVIAPNTGSTRTGTVSVAGIPVSVTQPGIVPSVNPGGLVNAASFAAGLPVAPGSIATVYGDFLTTSAGAASSLPLPNSLAGLVLRLGNVPNASLFTVSDRQVNFQVPWELTGQSQTSLTVTVNSHASAAQTVNLASFAPGIFSMNAQGSGQGAILDTSYRLVDGSNPATAGSTVIQIYCTGLGPVTNQPASGSPALSDPISSTTTTPAVSIGGKPAAVLFSGLAPGAVGEYQVNVLVPAGSSKGAAIPVVISIGGATSNTVTIAVQ
jgi:uncharacterized protein (TIGR03437 family)